MDLHFLRVTALYRGTTLEHATEAQRAFELGLSLSPDNVDSSSVSPWFMIRRLLIRRLAPMHICPGMVRRTGRSRRRASPSAAECRHQRCPSASDRPSPSGRSRGDNRRADAALSREQIARVQYRSCRRVALLKYRQVDGTIRLTRSRLRQADVMNRNDPACKKWNHNRNHRAGYLPPGQPQLRPQISPTMLTRLVFDQPA